MKKNTNSSIGFAILGLIIIISPIFFPIDWAYGKAIIYSYIGLGFAISILKRMTSKKITKTGMVSIVIFYVILSAFIISSISNYPVGVIAFL